MAESQAKKPKGGEEEDDSGYSPKSVFKDSIVFTSRKSSTNAIKNVLTDEIGCRTVNVCEDEESCKKTLEEKPKSALIIDWQIGAEVVVPLLKAARAEPSDPTRPILLLANNVTSDVVAIAMEYQVGRIAMGQMTASSLPNHLQQIVRTIIAENTLNPILKGPPPAEGQEQVARTPEQIIESLETAHEKYPNNYRVTVELAERLIEQEEWVKAEMLLHPLWTLDPPYLRALSAYSRCLMKKNAFDDAEFVLQKGKLINPHEPDRLVELGDLLLELGKYGEAMDNFKAAADIDPEHQGATVGKAKCDLLGEDINEALAILKEATSPRELASVFNTAAIISARAKRFEHSMSLYKAASQVVTGDNKTLARLKFNQGLAYVKWGRMKEALESFQEGAKLDPKFKKVAHNITVINKGIESGENVATELEEENFEEQLDVKFRAI